ncbi:MAG: hypothetical protein AB1450_13545 [Pseudomonadota bacterium]
MHFSSNLSAADITINTIKTPDSDVTTITLIGEIVKGDAERFIKLLIDANTNGAVVRVLNLYSRGGSTREAFKIGRTVRKYGINTASPQSFKDAYGNVLFVSCGSKDFSFDFRTNIGNKDCECASACALIWAAGLERHYGRVGFHRPYLRPEDMRELEFSEAQTSQESIFSETRSYLIEMGLSEELTNKMISTASKEIYFINEEEAKALNYDPAYDEWIIARCPTKLTDSQNKRYIKLGVKYHFYPSQLTTNEAQQYRQMDAMFKEFGKCKNFYSKEMQIERQLQKKGWW